MNQTKPKWTHNTLTRSQCVEHLALALPALHRHKTDNESLLGKQPLDDDFIWDHIKSFEQQEWLLMAEMLDSLTHQHQALAMTISMIAKDHTLHTRPHKGTVWRFIWTLCEAIQQDSVTVNTSHTEDQPEFDELFEEVTP